MRGLLLFFICCFPALAMAQMGLFDTPSTDKSIEYLSSIFGTMPGLQLQSDATPLFPQMVYIFNQCIFILGIIIVVYTSVVGTMNTAQEGEVLGKQWHTVLIPARVGFGIYLLLPTAGGYNWIQITVMWFIIQGIGAANTLWSKVIQANEQGGNIHQDTREIDLRNAMSAVRQIFTANVCMHVLNSDPTAQQILKNEIIQMYELGQQIQWGRISQIGEEQPLCGAINIPTVGQSLFNSSNGTDASVEERKTMFANAIVLASQALESAAIEAVSENGTQATMAGTFVSAARILQMAAQDVGDTFQNMSEIGKEAIENGWIHAGSYYFRLTQNSSSSYRATDVSLTGNSLNSQKILNLFGNAYGGNLLNQINTYSLEYSEQATSTANDTPAGGQQNQLKLNAAPAGEGTNILAAIFGDLMENIIQDLSEQMTEGGPNEDPILSMAQFGGNLAIGVELTFWYALMIVFVIWIASSIFSCLNPLGHAMQFLASFVFPIAILIITLLWTAGMTLGLYVPLIPYLVFTFGAIGWLILVIEAILGASLIALTLIVPTEDEIGKAGYAMVILLGLFMRPALMIVGFVLGIQVLYIAMNMLNFGFWATLMASTGGADGVGVFGMVAVIMIYAGLATGLVHEAFSLIYLLPNKVLRWMGGSPEDEEAGKQAKELKGSVATGAGIGKGAMTTMLTGAEKTMKGKGK